MSDRELLEMAAKACGFTINHPWNQSRLLMDPPIISLVVHKDGEVVHTAWNPLTDNGAALSLANRLCIDVLFYPGDEVVATTDSGYESAEVFSRGDDCSALRRAITRTAAFIGESMP